MSIDSMFNVRRVGSNWSRRTRSTFNIWSASFVLWGCRQGFIVTCLSHNFWLITYESFELMYMHMIWWIHNKLIQTNLPVFITVHVKIVLIIHQFASVTLYVNAHIYAAIWKMFIVGNLQMRVRRSIFWFTVPIIAMCSGVRWNSLFQQRYMYTRRFCCIWLRMYMSCWI